MSTRIIEWNRKCDSLGRAVAAIGVFDGVHDGHRALIADTVALAHEHEALSVVMTFDRDPEQVVDPDRQVPQLLTLEEKLRYIEQLGVDVVLVIPFCMRMAQMTPQRFLDDVLLHALDPLALAVGEDFRFGQHASGTVATLESFGAEHGFAVVAHELIERDGEPVTSTRIRALIASGDVEAAARLLGRPHRIPGRVVHGRGEGATAVGIPTANIMPWNLAALPADGVYAGRVSLGERIYSAAISIGVPPTYPAAIDKIEVHLIGFEGDLYNRELIVEVVRRLRDQEKFDSTDQLSTAIHNDIEHTIRIISTPVSPIVSEPADD